MSGALQLRTEQDLKVVLASQYMKAIENFFGDPDRALEFLSNVVALVQRNPKLLECTPETLLNSCMTMASLKLMPSGISGEAFILPYSNKGVMEAQFQLGYQGLVTLFYRAGARTIIAEIVRKNDVFSYLNGELTHTPDVFSDNRGEAIGAYVIVELQSGGRITKAMSKKDILGIGEKFSKSFKSSFSPWAEGSDPELWMWKKTVLKQAAKLVPKNETIFKALAEDNKDSIIADRKEPANDNFKLATATIDVDGYREGLQAATTIPELERAWADMPGDAKVALRPEAEAARARIMSEAKSDVV